MPRKDGAAAAHRLFIGSSTETLKRQIPYFFADEIRTQLPEIEPILWKTSFQQGRNFLENLAREVDDASFAAFFFMKDDPTITRDKRTYVPRDNVVLEAGLFLSRLSPRRVAFIVEEGASTPTDLVGLQRIDVATSADFGLAMHSGVKELKRVWGSELLGRPLGFRETIARARRELISIENRITLPHETAHSTKPISFSAQACIDTYSEALRLVQKRFWTTTFLTSAFWKPAHASILSENAKMMERVRKKSAHSIRRIFIIPSSSADFFAKEQHRIMLRQQNPQMGSIENMERSIERHRQNFSMLQEEGCEIRVSFDRDALHWNSLPADLREEHQDDDTELAIFDDFRVDLYRGGAGGSVEQVSSFTPMTKDFDGYRLGAEDYFKKLWGEGHDPVKFLNDWKEHVEIAKNRIHYLPNWLSKYDQDISQNDRDLKERELQFVLEILKDRFSEKGIKSYLDVGTCTGRYPLALAKSGLLEPRAPIYCIDADPDCIRFLQAKLADANDDVARAYHFTPIEMDFRDWRAEKGQASKFQVVTCMLGTLSHFGMATKRHPGGFIEEAIARLRSAVADNGLLILGSWSAAAKQRQKFLDIYTNADAHRLAEWTPQADRLESLLRKAKLNVEKRTNIPNLIDVYVCRPRRS